jgi:hypothetical protein
VSCGVVRSVGGLLAALVRARCPCWQVKTNADNCGSCTVRAWPLTKCICSNLFVNCKLAYGKSSTHAPCLSVCMSLQVADYQKYFNLPVAICRPTLISSCARDPYPGRCAGMGCSWAESPAGRWGLSCRVCLLQALGGLQQRHRGSMTCAAWLSWGSLARQL